MMTTIEIITAQLNVMDIKYDIQYDKARQFTLTINMPGHHIEVVESYIDDDMLSGEGITTHYTVFHNGNHVFTGNDMYTSLFVKLLFELIKLYK